MTRKKNITRVKYDYIRNKLMLETAIEPS